MRAIIEAELLKQKGSFHKKIIYLAPLVTIVLALVLMNGSYVQIGSYNWWYVMLLPSALTIMIYYVITTDRKNNFHGLLAVVTNKKELWYSKIITCLIYLTSTCLVFFTLMMIVGALFGEQLSIGETFTASVVLIITFMWQIPFWMIISLKSNVTIVLILSLIGNFGVAALFSVTTLWWIPFAIPARLMCSVIGVLPNGLLVEVGGLLLNKAIIFKGCFITVLLFLLLSYVTAHIFAKMEN